ncbi:MAG TPA: hypothetical protein VK524_14085, partial [Polyangiaceae bacterium]|nr:hypothetical protein [Polyangiaceae bacterium]
MSSSAPRSLWVLLLPVAATGCAEILDADFDKGGLRVNEAPIAHDAQFEAVAGTFFSDRLRGEDPEDPQGVRLRFQIDRQEFPDVRYLTDDTGEFGYQTDVSAWGPAEDQYRRRFSFFVTDGGGRRSLAPGVVTVQLLPAQYVAL